MTTRGLHRSAAWLVASIPILLLACATTDAAVFSKLSVGEAVELTARDGRLLLLDFRADWCPPCRRMEACTWPDEDLRQWLASQALVVQVDVESDAGSETQQSYRVSALPTVVALRSGVELDRLIGFASAPDLLTWLEDLGRGRTALDRDRERAGTRDDATLHGAARLNLVHALLRHHGRTEEAADEALFLWRARAEGRAGVQRISPTGLATVSRTLVPLVSGFHADLWRLHAILGVRMSTGEATIDEGLVWLELNSVLGVSELSIAWLEPRVEDPGLDHFFFDYVWWLLPTLTHDGHWTLAGRLIRTCMVDGLKCWVEDLRGGEVWNWARLAVALAAAGRDAEADRVLRLLFGRHESLASASFNRLLEREDVTAALAVLPSGEKQRVLRWGSPPRVTE